MGDSEMSDKMVDVIVHLDENITSQQREDFRDSLLQLNGVFAANYGKDKPHLINVEYDPDAINSGDFLKVAQGRNLHAELVGL